MSLRNLARLIAIVLGAVSLVACSGQSPVVPDAAPGASTANSDGPSAAKAGALAGSYVLSFWSAGQQVTQLTAGSGAELNLKAHVEVAATGVAVQSGEAIFEYCAYKRLPPNDITRADEAPLQACADGTATWKRLVSVRLNQFGDAYGGFGSVQIPRTVGFRFRYAARQGNVASGISAPRDFVWI